MKIKSLAIWFSYLGLTGRGWENLVGSRNKVSCLCHPGAKTKCSSPTSPGSDISMSMTPGGSALGFRQNSGKISF